MSDNLPAPQANRLTALTPSSGTSGSGRKRAIHWRRPRLERVTCLSFGGGLLAAGGGELCCLWDTRTHQLKHRFVAAGTVLAVSVSRDGTALAIATGPTVTVHDIDTGARCLAYEHHSNVTSLHIDGKADLLVSADQSGIVQVRESRSGRIIQTFRDAPGRPIVHTHGGQYVLVGCESHSTIYDATTGEPLRRFPYGALDPQPQDSLLLDSTLVAPSGSIVRWFDCSRREPAHCVRDLGSPIQNIDLHESSSMALAATQDGGLHLFGLSTGTPRIRYESFTTPVLDARFGGRGTLYVAGGEPLVMQLDAGRHVRSYYDESPLVVSMAIQRERDALLVSDRDGAVVQVSLRDGTCRRSISTEAGSVSVVSSSATHIATGAYDGKLRLFDHDLTALAVIDIAQGPVQAIVLEAQSRCAWVGTWSGRINRIDLDGRCVVQTVEACASSVRSLALDAQGQRLCAVGNDGEVTLFDLFDPSGHPRLTHTLHQPGTPYRATFDSEGNLWTCAGDGVRRYRLGDPKRHELYPCESVRWFELSGDKLYALTLSGTLSAFDIASRRELHRTVIDAPVYHRSVAVLGPDRIATASADGFVRVFDSQLRMLATFEVLRDGFLWSTPSADAHPGWFHTNRPELLCVGERAEEGLTTYAESDPRRARHLAVFDSAMHVMRIVRGEASGATSLISRSSELLGAIGSTRQLSSPARPRR